MTLVKRRNNDWLPSVFDDFFRNDWLADRMNLNNIGMNVPAVNIQDNENEFVVELAAPGKKKEDFNIELDNEVLTISSEEKKENRSEEKGKYTRREYSYNSFTRSFTLPDSANSDKIAANYEDGVLKITIPKREDAKIPSRRKIEIS
ncbi:MAG TPA: Hsp20/alpha crystallin family protein [Flavobacteriaceae bacterium]|nr:Hsp20/alpha crystallin family protein [Flavobacteriaceae bacterium]